MILPHTTGSSITGLILSVCGTPVSCSQYDKRRHFCDRTTCANTSQTEFLCYHYRRMDYAVNSLLLVSVVFAITVDFLQSDLEF